MKDLMPLVDMLKKYVETDSLRLNMPGHKGRYDLDFLKECAKADITECSFSDNLMNPVGVIQQAQEMYASLFGAKKAYFCVNGSTSGIWAMMATSKKILVMRNSHRAVFNATEYLKIECYVLGLKVNNGKFEQPSDDDILKSAIKTGVDTVFLTSPDYYGFCCGSSYLYKELKKRGIRLYIDSAHGAHFGLNIKLPKHSINFCDACVVSTHKTLSAFNQTAVVLVADNNLGEDVKKNLTVFTTTSPSYPLLASIDYAREQCKKSSEKYDELFKAVNWLNNELKETDIDIVKNDDFTRLVLNLSKIGGGLACEEFLEARNIYVEMADPLRIVCILTAMDGKKQIEMLAYALKEYAEIAGKSKVIVEPDLDKMEIKKYYPYIGETEFVALKDALERKTALDVGYMPPCLPILLKGERFDNDTLNCLLFENKRLGLYGVTKDGYVLVEK